MLVMAVKANGAERSYPSGPGLYCHGQHATRYHCKEVSLKSVLRCLIFIDTFRFSGKSWRPHRVSLSPVRSFCQVWYQPSTVSLLPDFVVIFASIIEWATFHVGI